MDVTIIGLQNAGKTSLLRVLAVSSLLSSSYTSMDLGRKADLTRRAMSSQLSPATLFSTYESLD